jgi:hypothetical protein
MSGFQHLITKVRDAAQARGTSTLSTGEAVAAALVLNRPDWLEKMGYSIADAIERVGPEWVGMIPAAAKLLKQEEFDQAVQNKSASDQVVLDSLATDDEVRVDAKLITYGSSPGYRDVDLVLDVWREAENNERHKKHRLCVRLTRTDSAAVANHVIDVHRLAWREGAPLDKEEHEQRPSFVALTV